MRACFVNIVCVACRCARKEGGRETAEGAAAASSGAIGGSSASVEAARAVAEEKFRRTGEEQEASATKLSTETWALKVKVLTDSITKLPPGTTRDSAEAQLQKLLDETPG